MSEDQREIKLERSEVPIEELVISEPEDSDDEFGDFEEVDQEEDTEEHVIENISLSIHPDEIITAYNGDYSGNEKGILGIINMIFEGISSSTSLKTSSDKAQHSDKFEFDERADKIFDQLIIDDKPQQHLMWKKSMIFKQLMLNLDIPVEDINHITGTTLRPNSNSNISEFSDLYEFERAIKENVDLEKLLKQIPEFKSMGIEKNGDIYNQKLTDTPIVISDAQAQINEQSQDEEKYLVSLMNTKKQLLELLSIWDERLSDTRVDNELFSSYVENLIGNTQKFRRTSKKAK